MGNWEPIWIATLDISPRISAKIQQKHGIEISTLRENLICNKRLRGRFEENNLHGYRCILYVEIHNGKFLKAYLDLIDRDYSAWSLRSALVTSQIPEIRR
jgi:hypothetical protein